MEFPLAPILCSAVKRADNSFAIANLTLSQRSKTPSCWIVDDTHALCINITKNVAFLDKNLLIFIHVGQNYTKYDI